MNKTLLSWSSGKDSAWTLHVLRRQSDVEVAGLFSTINEEYDRVAMHAVRLELLRRQAECVGLPLQLIPIPSPCSNAEYEAIMMHFVEQAREQGIEFFAFGDLFLEDIRRYREDQLRDTGITPMFPVWGMPTATLAKEMVGGGLRARITCVDPNQLAPEFSGREYDMSFLNEIPDGVDPCGENGEFHSFVFDGPMFEEPVCIAVGGNDFPRRLRLHGSASGRRAMIELIDADLLLAEHADIVVRLLDEYARDPMGGGNPLPAYTRENLVAELHKRDTTHVIIGLVDGEPAGLVICFEGFTTFACRPLLNIHDIVVSAPHRGKGLSRRMLEKAEAIARELGCCKLTLEVLEGNEVAQAAYRAVGFEGYELDPQTGKALFWEKKLTPA